MDDKQAKQAAKQLKAIFGDKMAANWVLAGGAAKAAEAAHECEQAGNEEGADYWWTANSRARAIQRAM